MKTNSYKFNQIHYDYIPDVIYSECIYTIECHKESIKTIVIFIKHLLETFFFQRSNSDAFLTTNIPLLKYGAYMLKTFHITSYNQVKYLGGWNS